MSGAQNEPAMSFYGVYDGHAGKDAAAFAASHLHGYILNSPYFPSDPVLAIKDAFHKTDNIFLEKGQKEVRKWWMLDTYLERTILLFDIYITRYGYLWNVSLE